MKDRSSIKTGLAVKPPARPASALFDALWCPQCQDLRTGSLRRDAQGAPVAFVPACRHDDKERRLRQLLREIEQHCPCGARPESPDTHPHVIGCPVGLAIELASLPDPDMKSAS